MKAETGYDYVDEDGLLLYQNVRVEDEGKEKTFYHRRPNGNGGWVDGLGNDVQRVPYRLPAILAAVGRVCIAEGERDVHTLEALGLVATSSKHFKSHDLKRYFTHVSEAVLFYDADQAGRKIRDEVLAELRGVCDVRVVDLPQTGEPVAGFDVTAWVALGHRHDELLTIIDAAPLVEDPAFPNFISATDLLTEPTEAEQWVVDRLLAQGGYSLLIAKPKVGKSTTAQNLALAVARGASFLGRATKKGTVLYLALEERPSLLRRHFKALGLTENDPIHFHIAPTPRDANVWLARAVFRYKPALVIIDTLQRFTRMQDISDYSHSTNRTESSLALARSSGAHILFLHHAKKAETAEDTDAALGSTGIGGSADIILRMKKNESGRRTIAATTMREGEPLEESVIGMDPETFAVWLEGTRAEADQQAATEKILAFLDDQGEPVERAVILEQVEGRSAIIVDALKALVGAGEVTKTGAGKKGDPFLFCRSHLGSGTAERDLKDPSKPHELDLKSVSAFLRSTEGSGTESKDQNAIDSEPETGPTDNPS